VEGRTIKVDVAQPGWFRAEARGDSPGLMAASVLFFDPKSNDLVTPGGNIMGG